MSYNIKDLKKSSPLPNKKYLVDANIWIKVISPKNKRKPKDEHYVTFIEKIRNTNKCKIILSALIISEVINRTIRDQYMVKFINDKGLKGKELPSTFYKEQFRPSREYKIGYTLIVDDFKNYLNTSELISDEFGQKVKFKDVLSKPNFNLDFNDNYYCQLAKKNNYTIVTDDKDFWLENIEILTLSETLLKKQQAEEIKKDK